MLKLNDVFFDEAAEIIRQLKEAVDKLVKELQELFENVIDEDAYKDTKRKEKEFSEYINEKDLYKSKYTRENNYYKNQFRLTKRHVCIRNKYKR